MVNGHAALRVSVELEPIATPKSDAGAPIEITPTATELEIGRRVAAAVIAVAGGIDDFARHGALSASSKEWVGANAGLGMRATTGSSRRAAGLQ